MPDSTQVSFDDLVPQQQQPSLSFDDLVPAAPQDSGILDRLKALAQTPSPAWLQPFEQAVSETAKGVPGMLEQLPGMAVQGLKFATGGPEERRQVIET